MVARNLEVIESVLRQLREALNEVGVSSLSKARIKIDVGLSLDAPHTIEWLRRDSNIIVFGFEPLPVCLNSVEKLFNSTNDLRKLRRRFILVPFALGEVTRQREFFECEDPGVSSFNRPKHFQVRDVIKVSSWRLEDFLSEIEMRIDANFGIVEHLKTDCQGSDINVLRGSIPYLPRIAVITCEADSLDYRDSHMNDVQSIRDFLTTYGFYQFNKKSRLRETLGPRIQRSIFHRVILLVSKLSGSVKPQVSQVQVSEILEVSDPTFINKDFEEKILEGKIRAFQTH